MSPRKFNILFLSSMCYIAIMLYTNNLTMAYAYVALLVVYNVIDFDLGLVAYLMFIPLSAGLEIPVLLSITYTIIPCFTFTVNLIKGKYKLYKQNLGVYLFLLAFLSFLGMLLTNYFDYFHVLALLVLTFSIAYIIVHRIITNRENVYLISNALIAAGILAAIIPYLLSDGQFTRLTLGESVRLLSNTVGMAIILLLVFYVFGKQFIYSSTVKTQFVVFKALRIPIIIILISGLVATMSRGVIFAVSCSLIFLIANHLYKNLKRVNILPVVFTVFVIIIIGVIVFDYGLIYLSNFNINTDLLTERITSESVESGTSIRQQIWSAGLSGLKGWEILYGHGISSFNMLAKKNGYDYYAHSIFVDTLVTTGILGFGVLVFLLFKILYRIVHYKTVTMLALFIFLILGYITHGNMNSVGFWLLLAIIYGFITSFSRLSKPALFHESKFLSEVPHL